MKAAKAREPGHGLPPAASGPVSGAYSLGLWGERAAAEHLLARGWRVVGNRVRTRGGELDLLAWDRDTLVFVEVKSASAPVPGGHPCEQVDAAKRRRLVRAANCYLAGLSTPPPPCRFDVVTVVGRGNPAIEHFVGAFTA